MFRSSQKSRSVVFAVFALAGGQVQAQLTLTSNLNLTNANNLVTNGSFETGISSGQSLYWATGTAFTPFAVPPGWTSVGGTGAYALWEAGGGNVQGSAPIPDGIAGLYFGNFFVSSISSVPTFNANGTVSFSSAPTIIPFSPAYSPAVKLSQTIIGLIPTATYGFSFWVSGEDAASGNFLNDGIFGLDVSGYNTVYLTTPGGSSALGTSHVYEFTVVPNATSLTIEFTNWGHYYPLTNGWSPSPPTTELVLDNVIMKSLASVPEPSSIALLVGMASVGGIMLKRRHS